MIKMEKSNLYKLFEHSTEDNTMFTIGVTVDTGLEWQAVDECREKVNSTVCVVKERGKIYFNISLDQFSKVQEMRSIDNIFVIADVRKFAFDAKDKGMDLATIESAVLNNTKLEKSLDVWKVATCFPGKVYPTIEEFESAIEIHKLEKEQTAKTTATFTRGRKRGCDPSVAAANSIVKYRVTCERTGKHTFESGEVARVIGGALQDKYHWLVDLTLFHLEIVCNVIHNELIMGFRVTHESKHRRNITYFGPTTLRATVCYNLLRLACPKPGDIIIDPMCGGGSIPIEAAVAYPRVYVLCGDNHDKAVSRTKLNIEALTTNYRTDLIWWNVSELPLRNSFVDIFVTDMPFGKRSGTMADNRILYKKIFFELGRVTRLKTGRLVLLTYDRRSISLALQATSNLFRVTKMLGVNMGGLQAAVYVLKRSNMPYDHFESASLKPLKDPKTNLYAPKLTNTSEDQIIDNGSLQMKST